MVGAHSFAQIYTNMSSFMSTELPKGCLPAEEMVGEWKVLEDIEDIHKNRQSFIELVKGEIISEAYQLLGHKQSEDPDEEDVSRSAFYHEFLMKNKVLLQSFLDDHAANLISVDDLLNILDPAHAPETINAPADDISFDTLYRALMVLTLDNYEEGVIWTNLCRIILGEVDEVSQKDLYIMVCLLTMTRREARATHQTAADFERQPNAEVRTTEHNSMGMKACSRLCA